MDAFAMVDRMLKVRGLRWRALGQLVGVRACRKPRRRGLTVRCRKAKSRGLRVVRGGRRRRTMSERSSVKVERAEVPGTVLP